MKSSTVREGGFVFPVLVNEDGEIVKRGMGWPVEIDDGDASAEAYGMLRKYQYEKEIAAERNKDASALSAGL